MFGSTGTNLSVASSFPARNKDGGTETIKAGGEADVPNGQYMCLKAANAKTASRERDRTNNEAPRLHLLPHRVLAPPILVMQGYSTEYIVQITWQFQSAWL